MTFSNPNFGSILFVALAVLVLLPAPVAAFGAGNIPSVSVIEGQNFRHGGNCFLPDMS